tara:strand:+ start:900 stop:1301 length:402 start_codon:yes stop_codon:yes gene_type:complete
LTNKDTRLNNIVIPISIGELFDKITILEIKKNRMSGNKLKNVTKELESLRQIIRNKKIKIENDLLNSLKQINNTLWEIEDEIRVKENQQNFDKDFIQLARSVYIENDKRAFIKKEINIRYDSNFIEEKSYEEY